MLRLKFISIVVMISILINVCFQGVIGENIINPFEQMDQEFLRNVDGAGGGSTTLYSATLFEQKNDQKYDFIVRFTEEASLVQIYNSIKNYQYKILGYSKDKLFEIQGEEQIFIEKNRFFIKYTSPIALRKACRTPNDPQVPNQWPLNTLNLKNAWNQSVGSTSVKIAVLDSGVDRSTKDLGTSNILPGYDLNTKKTVVSDENGHGTSVISLLASSTNNKSGMAGVCWRVSVEPYKIYDENGETDTGREIEALKMAAESGCKIINLSFGGEGINKAEKEVISELVAKGILIFAAAGNEGKNIKYYPASYSNVFSIAACDKNGNRWSDSNYNESVDISAPGKDVPVIGKYGSKYSVVLGFGTSFATPQIAGIVALACSLVPDIDFEMLHAALPVVCRDRGSKGFDKYYGYGILDANKLMDYANKNWVMHEPSEIVFPTKHTVTSNSKPMPGMVEFFPKISGTYYIKSLGTKDTDMDVFQSKFDSKGGYTYDLSTPYTGDSLRNESEVLKPFSYSVKMSSNYNYLLNGYSGDKCKGENMSFLIFTPYKMLGTTVKFSSNKLASGWDQELIYKAKYKGLKSIEVSSSIAGGIGSFSVLKDGVVVGKSSFTKGKYLCFVDANEDDVFSIIFNSDSNVEWTLHVEEQNNEYNTRLKELNVEGGNLDKAFSPSVYNYNINATNALVTIYWLTYFSSISTKIDGKLTRTKFYKVLGGAKKSFVIKTEDGKGNVGEYKFNLNADPKVVGSPTPTASPKPSKTPTPVSKAKPYISTMTLVEKNNADFLSVQVSWNIRANLKLYVLNNKEKVVKIIWTSVQIRAGKKTVLWNLKDSKNVSIKVGLYRMKFAADEKYFSKWFRKI